MLREQEFEEVEHGMTVWEREELFAAWRDELKDGRNNAGCVTVEGVRYGGWVAESWRESLIGREGLGVGDWVQK